MRDSDPWNYQNVPTLANPVNDGVLVAAKLKQAGFDVVDSRHDPSAQQTRGALRDFEDRAMPISRSSITPGNGIEVDGKAQASGSDQIVCDMGGCRPVKRGCHLEFRTTARGGGGNVEICN